MTGPAPRHDHQSTDQWAQQGLVNSQGRTSPESDVPEVPDGGGLEAANIPTSPAGPPPERSSDDDALTAAGAPGTASGPGDAAETAAYEGDGAYSEGQPASGPPAG
jgi:hypothetical protein